MALYPQSFIDELKIHASIVSVIQDYVPLKKAGRTYKGLCPFHSEKTPSFNVDPDKGFFHCFGCHAGGDVFKFLELHEKVGFQDAVRMLAQKFGMSLPETVDSDDARSDARLRESLLKLHEVAVAYFREQLAAPPGGRARQQLKDRAVAAATIDQLGLGYAPHGRDTLRDRLLKQGFSEGLLLQSGLVVKRESGELVDRFRHRLMIPICRESDGSVIAFGGRQMDPDQGGPKYLNSPETAIYTKGRTLYGLNLSKAAIRARGFAVMVEGYFDFAQVFQAQAAPVVATCGTALTSQQIQLLRRFTTQVVLSFDQDAAGQGAAIKSCELLVADGFNVNVLVLDKGEDPDTFIRRKGGDQYRERLRTSRPYLEYLVDQAAAGLDFGQDEQRRQFLGKMLAVAAKIPEATARDQFADKIAHKARVTEEVVRDEIKKAAVHKRTEVPAVRLLAFDQLKPAEKGLIWGLFHDTRSALAALNTLDPEDLAETAGRDVFEVAQSLKDLAAEQLPSALLGRLSTVNAQLVTSIAANTTPTFHEPLECARTLKRMRLVSERAGIQREIDRLQNLGLAQHGNEIDVLLKKKNDLGFRIEGLT